MPPLFSYSALPRFPASPLPSLRSILLFALFTLPFTLAAQYFTIGADPASVKWNQIKTSHFKLIYPESWEPQAKYIANAFEYGREPVSEGLGVKTRKWPVILHNRSVVSNAFAPYAPKRIEIITTPPQDNYAQDWIDQLILHEYRHSVQYTSIDRGLTHALSFVFGQQAVPAVIGLFVPLWFIEGDAVITETALSHSGRGRLPSFEMKLRAQFLERGIYSYDKAVNSSFRDYIPNHYELGYLLVGMTRKEYGKDVWNKVMHKTGSIPLMMVPFSNTLYKETGYGKSRLYQKITGEIAHEWQSEDQKLDKTASEPISRKQARYYTNQKQAVVLGPDRIVAIRSSIDDITRVVIIDSTGSEKVIATPGTMTDEGLSASKNLVCWAEVDRDPRWQLQKYSVIKLLDLESGKMKQLSGKSRYFSPEIRSDGTAIVVVELDEESQNFLVILNSGDGKVIRKIPAEKGYFLSHPAWSSDGSLVAMIVNSKEGKSIAIADPEEGHIELMMPFSYSEISRPAFYGDYILYTSAYTGIDNIFAIDINTKSIFQLTSSRFGATDAAVSPDENTLYYSDYSSNGYKLVTTALNSETWTKWDAAKTHRYELAETLSEQEKFIYDHKAVPDSVYESKPYRKGLHLFNFHSWAPLAVDIDNMDINPGVSLLSQNLLGTSYLSLGYKYNLNEETGIFMLDYRYEGLYPAFDLGMDYGLQRAIYTDTSGQKINYKYNELNLSGGISVPLNWYVRSWFMGFQPYAGYSYKYLRMDPKSELKFKSDRFNSLDYRLFFYSQSRQSYRDLLPRWGQLLEINYRHTPLSGDTANSIFSVEMVLYFPGIFKHHGIKIYGGYQDRFADDYYYSSLINFPRGYTHLYSNSALSGSISYEFPILYPDLNIGPVLYLKRVKAAIFYDHTLFFDTDPYQNYNSIGADLTFDFHLFRLFAPLEAGLRTIYLPQDDKFVFEFLYRINLDGIY